MTCNVFSGTSNPTQSILNALLHYLVKYADYVREIKNRAKQSAVQDLNCHARVGQSKTVVEKNIPLVMPAIYNHWREDIQCPHRAVHRETNYSLCTCRNNEKRCRSKSPSHVIINIQSLMMSVSKSSSFYNVSQKSVSPLAYYNKFILYELDNSCCLSQVEINITTPLITAVAR